MPLLQVLSSKPRTGKTTVAVALAQGLAGAGSRVQLLRIGDSEAARADAETFATLGFAAVPAPVKRADAKPAPGHLAVVELDGADEPLDAPAVVVVRGGPGPEDEALGERLGQRLLGTVATVVPPGDVEAVARSLTNAGLRPLAILPEDFRLAAPLVEDLRHALAADVLYEGENLRMPVEHLLVAPVYTDGAKLHFRRFPGTRAVLTPSYKTDLILAAIEAEAAAVVITGGHQPSPYVIDRAQGEPVTLLLAQHQTPAAVAALSDVWTKGAFSGDSKVEAVRELLSGRIDWANLLKKIQ
ncbi:MAG TPA: DRTGG domain-containing protein [Dehalococcoidia bacterium]|nr:DRTGG domain-containing protein [Dehalococcoidia bacterium]